MIVRIKKIIVAFAFLLLALLSPFLVLAQVTVDVKIDTNVMLIGDQTRIRLEAQFPDSLMVSFPVFSDTIIKNLEILDISDFDTVIADNGLKISQSYLVTSFDSGFYIIPPMKFVIGLPKANRIDTLNSNPLYVQVWTMPLDTTNREAIADIKKPIDAPLTLKEILPFAGIGFGIILFAFIAYLLFMKYVRKKPVLLKKEKPKEPAHIIALRNLDMLDTQKLWQKGLIKEYYSQLTEVIRTYVEDRYAIPAMESTTDQIMESFRLSGDLEKEVKNELFDVLVRADFVKFAKATTLANENEQSMRFAYDFVNKTKLVEALRNEESDTTEQIEMNQAKK
jgi:hypothetical protein